MYFFLIGAIWFYPVYSQNNTEPNSKKEQKKGKTAQHEGIKATTENGETVILQNDGTWEYETGENLRKPKRTTNAEKFRKPLASKSMIKGKNVNYEVYYNDETWGVLEKNINDMAEYSLLHNEKKTYAIIMPEKTPVPPETLRDIIIDNAQQASSNMKILQEEDRRVNGLDVIMVKIKADIQDKSFIYIYYIYSDDTSSIQLVGFTTEEFFNDYKKDIEDLLNGFMIKRSARTRNIPPEK